MVDKSKEKSAIETAMMAGLHLDPHEAMALIKSGFFKKNNAPVQTIQPKPIVPNKKL